MAELSISDRVVRVASIVSETDAEGPGRRFALWVQGCNIRCEGCFNPHLWRQDGGRAISVDDLIDQVSSAEVEGVTFLGGEPFEQARSLSQLSAEVQDLGLSVMTFTGHEHDYLTGPSAPDGADLLLAHTDLLVDGPYTADKPDRVRPWVGSTNQRFHFLTDRYRHLGNKLTELPDRVEVRVGRDGEVSVNGWAGVAELDDLLAGTSSPLARGKVR